MLHQPEAHLMSCRICRIGEASPQPAQRRDHHGSRTSNLLPPCTRDFMPTKGSGFACTPEVVLDLERGCGCMSTLMLLHARSATASGDVRAEGDSVEVYVLHPR
jgi:hypothetical protein